MKGGKHDHQAILAQQPKPPDALQRLRHSAQRRPPLQLSTGCGAWLPTRPAKRRAAAHDGAAAAACGAAHGPVVGCALVGRRAQSAAKLAAVRLQRATCCSRKQQLHAYGPPMQAPMQHQSSQSSKLASVSRTAVPLHTDSNTRWLNALPQGRRRPLCRRASTPPRSSKRRHCHLQMRCCRCCGGLTVRVGGAGANANTQQQQHCARSKPRHKCEGRGTARGTAQCGILHKQWHAWGTATTQHIDHLVGVPVF